MGRGLVVEPGPDDEAQFIYAGMTTDKWPFLTRETVKQYLDDPSMLDDQECWEDFIDSFFSWVSKYKS